MATDPGLQESRLPSGSSAETAGASRPVGDRSAGSPDRPDGSTDRRDDLSSRSGQRRGNGDGDRPTGPPRRRPDDGPQDESQGAARAASDGPEPQSRRRLRRSRKVRKVHRVVRHIEVWSVMKLATLFLACFYVIGMVSGYLLWRAADRVGTIDGIEGFFEDAGGYDRFEILGDAVFRATSLLFALVCALVLFTILMGVVLFNLVSDLTGGIRMTVIDEDLVVAPARRRRPADGGTSRPPGAGTRPPTAR